MPETRDAEISVLRAEIARLQAEVDGLRTSRVTRAPIEQAKGVIAAWLGCEPEQAFRVLVERSQHRNRKVHAIALELVDTAAHDSLDALVGWLRDNAGELRSGRGEPDSAPGRTLLF